MSGALVQVIGQFLHPPIGLCSLESIPGGPFTGLTAHDRVRGPVRVDAFGIRWLVHSAPTGYGIEIGAGVNFYDRPVLELAVIHQMFSGDLVVTAQSEWRLAAGYIMFDDSFPYIVDVLAKPGIELDLWWILAL